MKAGNKFNWLDVEKIVDYLFAERSVVNLEKKKMQCVCGEINAKFEDQNNCNCGRDAVRYCEHCKEYLCHICCSDEKVKSVSFIQA